MEQITRLIAHYAQCPPRLSYGGPEGTCVKGKLYPKWPDEDSKLLGVGNIQVWAKTIPAIEKTLLIEGYCVVDACLDETGHLTPEAVPLWPEMEGHELYLIIYVDPHNRILVRAIGGFTSYKTRTSIRHLI